MMLRMFKADVSSRVPRKKLMKLFEIVMRGEFHKQPPGTVNLVFCDDNEIQRLNKEYRKINKPTDVLSFNLEKAISDEAVFGEVYISLETARKQADEYQAPLSEEILRLSCHGFLHLLGYDHMNERDEKQMKTAEDAYLGQVDGSV